MKLKRYSEELTPSQRMDLLLRGEVLYLDFNGKEAIFLDEQDNTLKFVSDRIIKGSLSAVIMNAQYIFIKQKEPDLDLLVEVVREFCDRCEKGEVRSTYSYEKFKQALGDT